MRTSLALIIGGLVSTAAFTHPVHAQPVAQPTLRTFSQDTREQFRAKFENAIKIGASKEMARLMRANLAETGMWIVELAHFQVVRPLESQAELFGHLETTWQKAKRTEFPAEMRRFHEGLQGGEFKLYAKLKAAYHKLVQEYFKEIGAEGGPKGTAMIALGERFDRMANDFDGLGCDYYASQCHSYSGMSWSKEMAQDLADLKKSCAAYGKLIETRERMGFKDVVLVQAKPHYQKLVNEGHGPEGLVPDPEEDSGNDEEPEEVKPGAASNLVNTPLKFELLKGLDQFNRPNYFLDEHYQIWQAIFLAEVGSSSANLLRFDPLITKSGVAVKARREGSAKLYVDMNGDEEFDENDKAIPMRGKLEPVHLEIPIEGRTHHLAFFARTGQKEDRYQGLQANLEPTDGQVLVYSSPAGSMVGTVGGESLRIIDEDMDGVYGSPVLNYAHDGLTEGNFQPEFDSMVVGSSKRALPWSRYVKVADQWFDIQSVNDGTSLGVAPVELKTGILQLKFKGPKPAFVIVQGTENLSEAFFDISSKGKVEVPTGTYKLLVGSVTKGKKQQLQKVLMIPGATELTWEVTAGNTTKVELGAPFKFDFKCDVDTKGGQVIGSTLAVVGMAGERYERAWLCVPKPKASGRKAGAKRGAKPEKMPMVTSTEKVTEKGWVITWFPGDFGIDIKNAGGKIEVQLSQKKHPLFGKISSDWLPFER